MSKVSAVYCITFEGTDKVYIGQSTNIQHRWNEHYRNYAQGTGKYKLQEAYNIYGEPHFHIIEECLPSELNELEGSWINEFNSIRNGFNICGGGKAGYGPFNSSSKYTEEEVLEVWNLLQVEPPLTYYEIVDIIPNITYWLVAGIAIGGSHAYLQNEYPLEHEKVLQLNKIRTKKAHRTIGDKASAAGLGIVYPKIISPTGEKFEVVNATQFAESRGLDPSCLVKVLKGKRLTHKGWKLNQD